MCSGINHRRRHADGETLKTNVERQRARRMGRVGDEKTGMSGSKTEDVSERQEDYSLQKAGCLMFNWGTCRRREGQRIKEKLAVRGANHCSKRACIFSVGALGSGERGRALHTGAWQPGSVVLLQRDEPSLIRSRRKYIGRCSSHHPLCAGIESKHMELRAIVNNTAELFVPTATAHLALITLARATAEILGSVG